MPLTSKKVDLSPFLLKPLLLFEIVDLGDSDEGHDCEAREITVAPVEFGHVQRQRDSVAVPLEVHTPDTREKGEGTENGGQYRENPHDFVGTNSDRRKVELH